MLYWQKTGSDGFGKPIYLDPTAPITLSCRWEDKQQELLLPDGRKVRSCGYLLMADNGVVGSLVFRGSNLGASPMADWQALPNYPAIPTVTQGTREVLLVKTTPAATRTDPSSVFEWFL